MSNGEQGPKPVVSSEWDSLADLEEKREELNPDETIDERGDFDIDRLKESYPKNDGESDEDYEKRLAGMEEAAKSGTSKLEETTNAEQAAKENREAAEKLEEVYERRVKRFDEKTKEGLADVADVLSGGANDERYKAVAEKRKADNAKKAEALRSQIDEAVKAGTAAELLAKLQEEDRLDAEFEQSQIPGEGGLDGTKDGEVKEAAKDLMKEYFARLDEVEAGIKDTEGKIKGAENAIEDINGLAEDKKAQAKEKLDKVFEHIDAEKMDDGHKDRLKELAQKRYETAIKEIEEEHQKALSEKQQELAELNGSLEEQKAKKEDIESDLDYVNQEALAQRKEIRKRFNATVSEPGQKERYEAYLENHDEENRKNLEETGRSGKGEKSDEEVAEEVVEGIAGGAKEEGKEKAEAKEKVEEKVEKMNKEEFLEHLKKWRDDAMKEIDEKYNELMKKFNGESVDDGASIDDEPIDVGDLGAAEVIKNAEMIEDIDFDNMDLEELEALDADADEAISDIDAKEKYGVAAHYVANVPIDDDKPVEFYVEQMKRVFADEDLNNEAWEMLERNMNTRYANVRANQQKIRNGEEAASGRALDLEAGTEAYAETAEGKLEILKGDVEKAKNARVFIRDLELEDIEGLSVEQVMDKVIRPKFFGDGSLEGGKAEASWRKLLDRMNALYASYGLNAKGERETNEEADEKRKKKGIASRIRAMFRRGE